MHALLSIAGVFALILVLTRLKVPLAAAIIAGAAATGVLFGQSLPTIISTLAEGVVQPRTLGLVVITLLQLLLSHTLQSGGELQRIVELARGVLRRPAVAMAALPAVIGLLPMPGGALFSAPMVATAAGDTHVPPSTLSAINYWFRHIWEHWWPVYPGVVLAMTLTGRPFSVFAATQVPLGLIMTVCGLLIFRGTHPDLHASQPRPPRGTHRALVRHTAPVWLIVALAIPAGMLLRWCGFSRMPGGSAELALNFGPVAFGLVVALAYAMRQCRQSLWEVAGYTLRRDVWPLLLLVISVMMFQHVLTRVQAAAAIAAELQQVHVPVVLVIVLLPFVAGAVTGLAVGFVGTSFPIVLPLITVVAGEGGALAPWIALAYAFGHLGQMLSPLHLCYVVSNKYFDTSFGSVYRHILLPAAGVALLTLAYIVLLVRIL